MVNQGMTGSVYAALAYINGLYKCVVRMAWWTEWCLFLLSLALGLILTPPSHPFSSYDDTGQAALDIMAGCAKNSWCNMLREGATATMEAWTTDEKPNLSW